jgi:hypothetical protein
MKPAAIQQFVQLIHGTPARLVLAVTGGGSCAIAELLQVPGASRTLLEAVVPYSDAAMIAWLGGRPDQFCSEPTGRAMAMAAYRRVCRYQEGESVSEPARPAMHSGSARASPSPRLAGVGCTASLASDRPKRGPHRIHAAIQTGQATVSRSVELVKGRRTRAEEEQVAALLVLNAVAQACGLEERLDPGLLADERIDECHVLAPRPWQELLAGSVETVRHGGTAAAAGQSARAVFPGAFHPIHAGHRRMAEIARQKLGAPVDFEISILNVDKPPLDFIEIDRRVGQFAAEQVVWLTRAGTFEEKSAHFPGATFVVGVDTLRRIADCRYHGGDPAAWLAAMERIAARGCRFLVFGRAREGRFVGLGDLGLQPPLRDLCQAVPADQFREDISSTAIRVEDFRFNV